MCAKGFTARPVGELSSGQFQRTLIAWALAGEPDALLFDEPTTGIDLGGEETVYGLLTRLQRERRLAMIVITHDLAVVHRLSSEVLCLNKRADAAWARALARARARPRDGDRFVKARVEARLDRSRYPLRANAVPKPAEAGSRWLRRTACTRSGARCRAGSRPRSLGDHPEDGVASGARPHAAGAC